MFNLKTKLIEEACRIEEDTEHSAKGHYNAANRWSRYHLWIGLPSAVLAAIAGGTAFNNMAALAGILAILSTALTTVLTFLKPSEHSENHKAVAGQYLSLRNQSRIFREIEIDESEDISIYKKRLIKLATHRDELNTSSPAISRKDYDKAKKDIDGGLSQYQIDKGGQ
jgi:hypothetical protein